MRTCTRVQNEGSRPYLRSFAFITAISVLALLAAPTGAQSGFDVLTHHNDNARTGANLHETILNVDNVRQDRFGKLYSRTVDGQIYAQPLYLSGIDIPGKGKHNVVYVATEHATIYAFDADDDAGPNADPLWRVSLADERAGVVPVRSADFDVPYYQSYKDLVPEIGVTGTPVISPDRKTLYVVASTNKKGLFFHRLYALDTATGKEILPAVEISWRGKRDGSSGPPGTFHPRQHLQRAGLLLAAGVLYIAFGSHGDLPLNSVTLGHVLNLLPGYHGWIFAYDAATLKRLAVYNSTAGAHDGLFSLLFGKRLAGGGIWMSAAGPSADADGNVYVSTGNGTFDGNKSGPDYGDSILKLRLTRGVGGARFDVSDSFTPYNQAYLNANDLDVGSCGITLLPDRAGRSSLLVGGGKQGKLYLVDRNAMGKFNKTQDSCVQSFLAAYSTDETRDAVHRVDTTHAPEGRSRVQQTPEHRLLRDASGALIRNAQLSNIHSTPVYWRSGNEEYVYIWGEEDYLKALHLKDGRFLSDPHDVARSLYHLSPGMPGGALSLSANGERPETGILWGAHPWRADANHDIVPGVLRAFNATPAQIADGTYVLQDLWASRPLDAHGERPTGAAFMADDLGDVAKFCPPTVANGKVYMGTASCQLEVYGLLQRREIVPATADTFVQAGDYADLNLSGRHAVQAFDDQLKLKEEIVLSRAAPGDSPNDNRCGYLLFDLTGYHDRPKSAMLTLTIPESTPTTESTVVRVYAIDDSPWLEGEMTWNNAPGLNGAEFRSTGQEVATHRVFFKRGSVTFDLTRFVSEHMGQMVTLQLIPDRTEGLPLGFLSGRNIRFDSVAAAPAASSPQSASQSATAVTGRPGSPVLVLTWY